MSRKGLGKGLDALFDENGSSENSGSVIFDLKLTQIEPNREQPRKHFDEEKLALLAESIKEHGLLQPITVNKTQDGLYTIVAGERRWRAAKIAGLSTIPAIIKNINKKTVTELALIENLQREDLNPIEEARGYKVLADEYGMTQEEISRRIGKKRSTVSNSLRFLSLGEDVQAMIVSGEISGGHAKAILSVSDRQMQSALAQKIVQNHLTVRQAEALAASIHKTPKPAKEKTAADIELDNIQARLSSSLGTKVRILSGTKKGRIEIEYYGNDDLERLMDILENR